MDASDSTTLFTDTGGLTSITHNALVARWNDKSGNGRYAIQGTSANRPTYVTNGFNSKGLLTFDASNDTLTNRQAALFQNVNGATIFAVTKKTGNTASRQTIIFTALNSLATLFQIRYGNNTEGGDFQSLIRRVSTDTLLTARGITDRGTNPAIYSAVANYSGGTLTLFEQGTQTASTNLVTSGSTTNELGALFIGADSDPSNYLNGNIAEIIITHEAMDSTSRQKTEGYLAHKWGLTGYLPTNHPYKVTAP